MDFFTDLFKGGVKSLELPLKMRSEFKDPLGRLFIQNDSSSPEEQVAAFLMAKEHPVIIVGDICAITLSKTGFLPAVAIIDNRTLRHQEVEPFLPDHDPRAVIHAKNPAGQVAYEAVEALQRGLNLNAELNDTIIVEIIGEEDLLVLPAVILASSGFHVIYGQPGEGIVVIEVTHSIQEIFTRLLTKFIKIY